MSLKQPLQWTLALGLGACGAQDVSSNGGQGGNATEGGASNGGRASASAGIGVGASGNALGGSDSSSAGSAAGGNVGVGGSFVSGGLGGATPLPPLDCGANGVAIENAGPPENRVGYVILGDGYDSTSLDTVFIDHLQVAMEKRFSAQIGQPYGRYRKFVNICAIKTLSGSNGIGNGPTAFSCTGDDQSRLADCDNAAAEAELDTQLPDSFEVDWHAIMLNNDRWWNTGSSWMLWSGAHADAAGAALHEGGHGFHDLADEYLGTSGNCGEYAEVNSTADQADSGGKWDLWMGYVALGATGTQGAFQGSRYCSNSAGQYRPSDNSMMNSLFGNDPDTSFNQVSREKIVMDIWRYVRPVDSTVPPEGAVLNPTTLQVNVIDPTVISIDWSVDGKVVAQNGGTVYDIAASKLASGAHTVSARAYDNAGKDLVRYDIGLCSPDPPSTNPGYVDSCWGRDNWLNSQQTLTWSVSVP